MPRVITDVIDDAACTGCAACVNICPHDALQMAQNANGFMAPRLNADACVKCGKCAAACPSLHTQYLNNPSPGVYAFRASDDIRSKCSSGGAFLSLAKSFITSGGIVCGAIFDRHQCARHALANTIEGVMPMCGSKYVQSDINFTYRRIQQSLKKKMQVLFVGTPCQVAGLKSMLDKEYAELYCADLICHGVPSQKMLHAHLDYLARGKEISAISFRDKRYGWNLVLRVEYKDGSIYEGKQNQDTYLRYYLSNTSLRLSCLNCPFCEFPRQGDISLGDFWAYNKMPGGDADAKGTSLIFVNDEKGEQLLQSLDAEGSYLKHIDVDAFTIANRLTKQIRKSANYDRFFSLLRTKNYKKACDCIDANYFDIALVGPFNNKNIGGFLTYYALFHVLSEMGYATQLLDPSVSSNITWSGFAEKEIYPQYAIAPIYKSKAEYRQQSKRFGQFVIGSDQILNPDWYMWWGKYFTLDWVPDNKKKIAYASSFGEKSFAFNEETRAEMSYFFQKFDAFSVREASGIRICMEQLGIKAACVLDPVFLCPVSRYNDIINACPVQNNTDYDFMHAYLTLATAWPQNVIEESCKLMQIPYRLYGDFNRSVHYRLNLSDGTINERLRDMRDCKFSITNSFHGTCFAIIFKKPFIVCRTTNRNDDRFDTLLRALHLDDRQIFSYQEFIVKKDLLLTAINYDAVYDRLLALATESYKWLRCNLEMSKIKPCSAYDFGAQMYETLKQNHDQYLNDAKRAINDLQLQLQEQRKLFESFKSNVEKTIKHQLYMAPCTLSGSGAKLKSIANLDEYIAELHKLQDYIIIIIAVKDTPCNGASTNALHVLSTLGISADLDKSFRRAFLAVISGGEVILERLGEEDEALHESLVCCGYKITIASSPYGPQCGAEIILDKHNLCCNIRGLNIVILDRMTGYVIDSAGFDTYINAHTSAHGI